MMHTTWVASAGSKKLSGSPEQSSVTSAFTYVSYLRFRWVKKRSLVPGIVPPRPAAIVLTTRIGGTVGQWVSGLALFSLVAISA